MLKVNPILLLLGVAGAALAQDIPSLGATYSEAVALTADQPQVEGQFAIDVADSVEIRISSLSKSLEVTLIDPDGRTHLMGNTDAWVAASVVRDAAGGRSAMFALSRPRPGIWKYRALETATVTGIGVVLFTMNSTSDLVAGLLGVNDDFPASRPVNLALMIADRNGGVLSSSIGLIHGSVQAGNGSPIEIQFADDGTGDDPVPNDGIYSSTFSAPPPGLYTVRVTITGAHAGQVFMRSAAGIFRVIDPCAVLTSSVQSIPIDTSGLGTPDALELEIGVNPVRNGNYQIAATISSATGNQSGAASNVELLAGAQTAKVRFDLARLRELGSNGPYKVEEVRVSCVNGADIFVADRRYDAGQTVSVDVGAATSARIPRSNGIGLTGRNTEETGAVPYQKLDFGLGLNLPVAGSYQWNGALVDANGTEIDSVSGSGTLPVGAATAVFPFSGSKIGRNAVHGPFFLKNVVIQGAAGPASFVDAGQTQPYPYYKFVDSPSRKAIEVSPALLDFGRVASGQTKDLVVTITSAGNATLGVSSIGSNSPQFTVTDPAAPISMTAGTQRSVTVRFRPAQIGEQTASLTISSDDPERPSVPISLVGVGIAEAPGGGGGGGSASIDVTPASLDFGSVNAGQTKELVQRVSARGTGFNVTSVTSSNPRFVMVNPSTPFGVGSGSWQDILIRFSPTAAGLQTGTLTIASTDPNRPTVTVPLTGTSAGGSGGGTSADLKVDDGTFELSTGFNQGGIPGYFVNRLTPTSYPATLRKVIVVFPPSGPPAAGLPLGSAIQLISASTASTGDQLTGLTLTRTNGTVTAFDTFIEYDVPALTIQSGSFVVGFTVLNPPGVFPALLDKSSQSARRSYVSDNGANFFLVDGIAGVGPGNLGIRARVEYTGSGGGAASTRVGTTVAAGWPNGRVSNNLPAAAIDGSTATFTWTTESYAAANPSYLGVGFAAATSISRIRLFKDNDAGEIGLIAKNLVIEYTTSPTSTPLSSRVWTPVTGLSNGFQGAELLNATSVNANGTVAADSHNSLASGWASLTFNAVSATGIRIGFSNATPLAYNHYRVYEFEVYSGESGGGTGGSGAITVTVSPSSVAPGGQVTVTWNAPGRNVVNDWVGLYRLGAATNSENLLRPTWESVFQPSGSKTFTMPATPGDYVFHYFTSSGYDLGATSNTIVSR